MGAGCTFKATYLARLYDELGDAFFGELNGTFSGMLVDSSAFSVKLFNDRMGFQKTFWVEDKNGLFHFSSEAKSLLRVHPRAREFDPDGLAQFLGYGCTFGETTLYKGISLMPGGSMWEFRPNTPVKKKTYFHPNDWQIDTPIEPHAFYEEFTEIFRHVVPHYFPEAGTGISLTGGWDTRMILSCLHAGRGEYPCYTFGGLRRETVDIRLARQIAKVAGQDHSVLSLQQDFLTDFDAHAEKTVYVSDGWSDVCFTHEIYLNRMARQVSPARVTGNFGSEILRAITTFKEVGLRTEYLNKLGIDTARLKEQLNSERQSNGASFAIFREIPWKLAAVSRLAGSQLSLRSPFLDTEVLKLACRYPTLVGSESRLPASVVGHEYPDLLQIQTDRGQAGSGGPLTSVLMPVFYSVTFKLDYLLTEGLPGFAPIFSDLVSADNVLPLRHKYLEYRRWFRGPLRGYVEDVLGGNHSFVSGLFGRNSVERTLVNNASGLRNELADINTLLTLELIDKCLLRESYDLRQNTIGGISVNESSR
jgi:asparagine synthase (glutamine-hydrolysing)